MTQMPTIQQALKLYDDMMKKRCQESSRFEVGRAKKERIHAAMVAVAAQMIASKIPEIDGEKAYIMGLMHDCGKLLYDDELSNQFHGLVGYKYLRDLGYDELARISLTHTFYEQELKLNDYANLDAKEMRKSRILLRQVAFDDYDRLIQLCNRLSVGVVLDVKKRFVELENTYRLPKKLIFQKYREALKLKYYFDKKCGCDVFRLLGVK